MGFHIALCIVSLLAISVAGRQLARDALGIRGAPGAAIAAFVCSASLIVCASFIGLILPYYYVAIPALVAAALIAHKLMKGGNSAPHSRDSLGPDDNRRLSFPVTAVLVIAGAVVFSHTVFALVTPPAPTDAFLDHLVFPAEWLKASKITMVQTLSPDQATTYYPANGELLYLWLMQPLGDDLITGLLEAVSLVFAALACVRIGRRLGLAANTAVAAAALAAMTPGAVNLTQQFGVDMFFAAAFLCSIAFLLPGGDPKSSRGEIVAAGLAAGLAVGTKYVGVPFALLLLPLVFMKRQNMSRPAAAAVFTAAAASTCAFWYFRNLAVTGSPFYPMGFDIAGIEIFRGAFDRAAMYNSYLHIPVDNIPYLITTVSELIAGRWLLACGLLAFAGGAILSKRPVAVAAGVALAAVAAAGYIAVASGGEATGAAFPILPAAAAAAFAAAVSSVLRRQPWWRHYTLWLAPLFILFYWYVNPYNTANNHRFVIPAVFIASLALAAVLEMHGKKWAQWTLAALAVPAAAATHDSLSRILRFFSDAAEAWPEEAWYRLGLQTGLTAALAIVFILAAAAAWRGNRRAPAAALLLAATAAFALFLPLKSAFMEEGRYRWYAGHYLAHGWQWLDEAISVPATIAYAGNCSPYGLYGDRLENRVVYINTDGRTDLLFHDYELEYRNNPGYIRPVESVGLNHMFRGRRDYDGWREALRREGVDLLFVSREFYRGVISDTVELEWAIQNPRDFRPAYRRGDVFIFMLVHGSGTKPD